MLGGYWERLEWGVTIREFRSKWKSASFFGLGSRPVTMEGRRISGRAHLFWAAQLNAVEHPAVAVNQVVYCKKIKRQIMGEGSIGRGRDGRLPIQAEEGLRTERAKGFSFHLWGTPDPAPARGSCSERRSALRIPPLWVHQLECCRTAAPCDTATEPALKYCRVCHQHQTPQCLVSSELTMTFKQ